MLDFRARNVVSRILDSLYSSLTPTLFRGESRPSYVSFLHGCQRVITWEITKSLKVIFLFVLPFLSMYTCVQCVLGLGDGQRPVTSNGRARIALDWRGLTLLDLARVSLA